MMLPDLRKRRKIREVNRQLLLHPKEGTLTRLPTRMQVPLGEESLPRAQTVLPGPDRAPAVQTTKHQMRNID